MILERDHIICPKVSKIAHVRSNGLQYSNAYCTLLSYQSDSNSIFFKAHNLPTLKCYYIEISNRWHREVKDLEPLYIRISEEFSCCVFWLAFGCCAHPRAGQNIFLGCFQLFLLILNLFLWFHVWNQVKTSKQQKRLKTAQKKYFASYQVRAAHKSCSKYTTFSIKF